MFRGYLYLGMILLALLGCTSVLPSSAQSPSPIASAAQPGIAAPGKRAYASRGAETIRRILQQMELDEALDQVAAKGLEIPREDMSVACASARGTLPVLVCHLGPSARRPIAQAIFWYERDLWHWQLYPQAPAKLAAERLKAFAPFECQIGCHGAIRTVRQEGSELMVVVDLGLTGIYKAEEVQLLHLVDGLWEVLWVPADGNWNYSGSQVTLLSRGLQGFHVQNGSWMWPSIMAGYLDEKPDGMYRRFQEQWVRKGGSFVLRDRQEESTPYAALVRIIHYLSTDADQKAESLIAANLSLESVRASLRQKPRQQRWPVTPLSPDRFALDTDKNGTPDLHVRFEKQADTWILAELGRPNR